MHRAMQASMLHRSMRHAAACRAALPRAHLQAPILYPKRSGRQAPLAAGQRLHVSSAASSAQARLHIAAAAASTGRLRQLVRQHLMEYLQWLHPQGRPWTKLRPQQGTEAVRPAPTDGQRRTQRCQGNQLRIGATQLCCTAPLAGTVQGPMMRPPPLLPAPSCNSRRGGCYKHSGEDQRSRQVCRDAALCKWRCR